MRRREFLGIAGASAVAWPFAVHAQQIPVIGFLSATSSRGYAHRVTAFKEGLRQHGYVEGQNVAIEYRWAEDRNEELPNLAADLVRRQTSIIVAAGGSATARAVKLASATIPIVFIHGGDPVQLGLVASLNRPGGNMTGVTILTVETLQKRLEILREFLPKANTFALLIHGQNPNIDAYLKDVQAAMRALRLRVDVHRIVSEREFDRVFTAIAERRNGGIVFTGDPIFASHRERLVELAARHGIPAIYPYRDFTVVGGLMSYGPNVIEASRQVGLYTGRILKGEKPSELPVLQVTNLELVVNQKTVRSLGLEVPLPLLMRINEVIE